MRILTDKVEEVQSEYLQDHSLLSLFLSFPRESYLPFVLLNVIPPQNNISAFRSITGVHQPHSRVNIRLDSAYSLICKNVVCLVRCHPKRYKREYTVALFTDDIEEAGLRYDELLTIDFDGSTSNHPPECIRFTLLDSPSIDPHTTVARSHPNSLLVFHNTLSQ